MNWFIYAQAVACSLMLACGQLIWKIGLDKLQVKALLSMEGIKKAMLSPYIWGGMAIYVVATVIWLNVLSKLPLSVAYPLMSIAYVFGLILAKTVLGESISLTRWMGGFVIVLGLILISRP